MPGEADENEPGGDQIGYPILAQTLKDRELFCVHVRSRPACRAQKTGVAPDLRTTILQEPLGPGRVEWHHQAVDDGAITWLLDFRQPLVLLMDSLYEDRVHVCVVHSSALENLIVVELVVADFEPADPS